MNRIITTLAILALFAGCQDSTRKDLDQYARDYSIGQNRFGVIVAENGRISKTEAEKYAIQKAAKVAHYHGYRYFKIDNESHIVSGEVPGYKIEFSCQETKPSGRYYDVCSFGSCD